MKDKCDFCGASYVDIKTTKHEGKIKIYVKNVRDNNRFISNY